MIKFSIIIPIFNVEKYLKKCLESIVNQTYKNFECILVCDDSADNSTDIAKEYARKYKFKILNYKNTGLSEARNIGVNVSKSDYILFLDSDDYFEFDLLDELNKAIKNEDLIRYQVREVFTNKTIDWDEDEIKGTGIECFNKIINFHYVENAWAYCYKASFYKKNNFNFMKNCLAEDFGLLPLIIAKASEMKVISFIGYNYRQREGSLMNNNDYNKKLKKMDDMIIQSKNLYFKLNEVNNNHKFLEFINSSLIYYSTTLKYKDYVKYKKILNKFNIYNYILSDNLKGKFKKMLIKKNAYIFYNFILRFLWQK